MMNIYVDPLVLAENVYYYQAKPVDVCGKEYDLPKYLTNRYLLCI